MLQGALYRVALAMHSLGVATFTQHTPHRMCYSGSRSENVEGGKERWACLAGHRLDLNVDSTKLSCVVFTPKHVLQVPLPTTCTHSLTHITHINSLEDNRSATSMSTTKSDRERMAALGARLMGSNIASTPSAPPSATAPRSMPTAAKSINRENMPLFTRPVPPEVRITPPVKRVEPASTTKMASVANESATNSTSVLHERKLNVPETSAASSSQNSSPSPVVGAAPSPVSTNQQRCVQNPH